MREAAVTPFMITVQNLLHGEPASAPRTVASTERSVAEATHTQVGVRSLAEQLVSEANVVLRDHGNVIELRDEASAGRLAFTLAYRDRTARVHTEMAGRTATARLTLPGAGIADPVELSSEHELRALVLTLIAT
jgi:hypothetical protein